MEDQIPGFIVSPALFFATYSQKAKRLGCLRLSILGDFKYFLVMMA
jgi:hypothetical protein